MIKSQSSSLSLILSSLAISLLTACGSGSKQEQSPQQPPVATAPVAIVDRAVVLNDTPIEVDVLSNDSQGSGGALTLTAVTTATYGSTSIVNNKIRYQSTANFLGTDSFSYTVTSGNLTATATVNVEGHQSVTLKGRVIDSLIPDASIKLDVNGETFSTTTDSQGYFSLPLLFKSAPEQHLLRIRAYGVQKHNQSYVTLSSLLETPTQILALRKSNQIVEMTEVSALALSPLTTARDLLIHKIAGKFKVLPSEMADAEISIGAESFVNIAATIKLLVDNSSFKIPEGFATIEEFANNSSAFEQFMQKNSQGDESPIAKARIALLANHNLPGQQPTLLGDYVRVNDSPIFLPSNSFETLALNENSISITVDDSYGQFLAGTKAITRSGNNIEIIDPQLTGYFFKTGSVHARSWLTDDISKTAWTVNFCPDLLSMELYIGYKGIKIIESNPHNFIAEITTFRRHTPVAGSECGNVYPQSQTTTTSRVVKFVAKNHLLSSPLSFDLATSRKWILPDVYGRSSENDLFTLNEDGTFHSLTGAYHGLKSTWSISTDKKTLSLTVTDPANPTKHSQMDLQISRKLDHGYSILSTFKNHLSPEKFSQLRSALPITGSGVIDLLAGAVGKNKIVLAAISSQTYEWQGRKRLYGDWYGWLLNQDKSARVPKFTCDGEIMVLGNICNRVFGFAPLDVSTGVWDVKNGELHVERGSKSLYDNQTCKLDKPCNLRVIVPLYAKDGLITGYEYNVDYRNSYFVKPRMMHWTIEDLPAQ